MGYFPNGTSGEMYEEEYCYQCVNWRDLADGRGPGCPVMDLHLFYNYAECNKPDSFLHQLIPRDEEGFNLECSMFIAKET